MRKIFLKPYFGFLTLVEKWSLKPINLITLLISKNEYNWNKVIRLGKTGIAIFYKVSRAKIRLKITVKGTISKDSPPRRQDAKTQRRARDLEVKTKKIVFVFPLRLCAFAVDFRTLTRSHVDTFPR